MVAAAAWENSIALIVGALIGWVASMVVKGSGSGVFADILYGIAGALLAGWILGLLGLSAGGILGGLITSVIGAIVVILVIRVVRRAV